MFAFNLHINDHSSIDECEIITALFSYNLSDLSFICYIRIIISIIWYIILLNVIAYNIIDMNVTTDVEEQK